MSNSLETSEREAIDPVRLPGFQDCCFDGHTQVSQHAIDPIDVIMQTSARSIARQHDGIVMALARERIPGVELHDLLRGRLQGFDFACLPGYREWILDGRPLVRFWPPEIEWTPANVMQITQKYQVFQ